MFAVCVICAGQAPARDHLERGRQRTREGREVEFDVCYDFSAPGRTFAVRVLVALPQTIPDKQRILGIEFSPEPARVFSRNGNEYAEFVFARPRKRFKVTMSVKAALLRYDLSVARSKPAAGAAGQRELEQFLKQEDYIESENTLIREIAESLRSRSRERTVEKIYDYVTGNMKYSGYKKKDLGAFYAATNKKGDCSEYADLFVALCRARNIPARVVDGYTSQSQNTPNHAWVEVYFDEYGWVPFDPTFGDAETRGAMPYDRLRPIYIHISHIRNDNVLGNYHFSWYYYTGEKVKVSDSIKFKKSSNNNISPRRRRR